MSVLFLTRTRSEVRNEDERGKKMEENGAEILK